MLSRLIDASLRHRTVVLVLTAILAALGVASLGQLPFDAAMAIVDVFLRAEPPRLMRSIVERWAGTLPYLNIFYARVGQVIGSRENFRQLLRSDQFVLVFPEGVEGIRKKAAERYVLQRFNVGFVEESLRHRVPIVPMIIANSVDVMGRKSLLTHSARVQVVVGDAIPTEDWTLDDLDKRIEEIRNLNVETIDRIWAERRAAEEGPASGQ